MEITTQDLIQIIGTQQVEIYVLKAQLAQLQLEAAKTVPTV